MSRDKSSKRGLLEDRGNVDGEGLTSAWGDGKVETGTRFQSTSQLPRSGHRCENLSEYKYFTDPGRRTELELKQRLLWASPSLPPPPTNLSSGCELHLEIPHISSPWVIIQGCSRFAFIETVRLDHDRQCSSEISFAKHSF